MNKACAKASTGSLIYPLIWIICLSYKVVFKVRLLLFIKYEYEIELIKIIKTNDSWVRQTSSITNYLSTLSSLGVTCALFFFGICKSQTVFPVLECYTILDIKCLGMMFLMLLLWECQGRVSWTYLRNSELTFQGCYIKDYSKHFKSIVTGLFFKIIL